MKNITATEWIDRITPYHFPSQFSKPLRNLYDVWKDPSDPLGSLLEIFKWAMISPGHAVPPSVFVAQVTLESAYGQKQDALLGIKATARDRALGTWKRFRTREMLSAAQVESLEKEQQDIEVLREVKPGFFEVKCWQDFHYEAGLADDFEIYFRVYEKNRPNRNKFIGDPEAFIKDACTGSRAYATDVNYPKKIIEIIDRYALRKMDFMIPGALSA